MHVAHVRCFRLRLSFHNTSEEYSKRLLITIGICGFSGMISVSLWSLYNIYYNVNCDNYNNFEWIQVTFGPIIVDCLFCSVLVSLFIKKLLFLIRNSTDPNTIHNRKRRLSAVKRKNSASFHSKSQLPLQRIESDSLNNNKNKKNKKNMPNRKSRSQSSLLNVQTAIEIAKFHDNIGLIRLISKFTVLICVHVITSLLLLLLSNIFHNGALCIDGLINALCALYLFSFYWKYYKKCCKLCNFIAFRICACVLFIKDRNTRDKLAQTDLANTLPLLPRHRQSIKDNNNNNTTNTDKKDNNNNNIKKDKNTDDNNNNNNTNNKTSDNRRSVENVVSKDNKMKIALATNTATVNSGVTTNTITPLSPITSPSSCTNDISQSNYVWALTKMDSATKAKNTFNGNSNINSDNDNNNDNDNDIIYNNYTYSAKGTITTSAHPIVRRNKNDKLKKKDISKNSLQVNNSNGKLESYGLNKAHSEMVIANMNNRKSKTNNKNKNSNNDDAGRISTKNTNSISNYKNSLSVTVSPRIKRNANISGVVLPTVTFPATLLQIAFSMSDNIDLNDLTVIDENGK